ncbi:MAG TPA: hypothetical protein VGH71_00130 [Gammaproteobacteria bacterium]|jgi:hypothetical protein
MLAPAIGIGGLPVHPQFLETLAHRQPEFHAPLVRFQHLHEAGDGMHLHAERAQGDAQALPGIQHLRREVHSRLEFPRRQLMAVQTRQHIAVVVVELRAGGREFHGAAHVRLRQLVPAGLVREHAEEVMRIRMVGSLPQDIQIETLGLGQLTTLMMAHGLHHERVQGGRMGGAVGHGRGRQGARCFSSGPR